MPDDDVSTELPGDSEIYEPLTPIYPFSEPGQTIDLHAGPIGGLDTTGHDGTISLVPFPTPMIRWQLRLQSIEYHHPAGDRLGDWFELSTGSMAGQAMITSVSDDSVAGIAPHLEWASGTPLVRVTAHWMNLPNYFGNATLRHRTSSGASLSRTRLNLNSGGWKITLDGHPRNDSLFKADTGLPRYVLTHVMELSREDGSTFDVESAGRFLDALRLTLSFGAARWVAPPLVVGFESSGVPAWQRWVAPICDPFEPTGTPTVSPRIFSDIEALVDAGVTSLAEGGQTGATGLQMQLAVQAAHHGMVENRIFSAFPALESLGWQLLVESKKVSGRAFDDSAKWPTAKRIREILDLAGVPPTVERTSLPAVVALMEEKNLDGPDAVVWVRNKLVHGKAGKARLYDRSSLVREAWQLSREYLALVLLYAIGYSGGYLSALPPAGFIGSPTPVPWQKRPDAAE